MSQEAVRNAHAAIEELELAPHPHQLSLAPTTAPAGEAGGVSGGLAGSLANLNPQNQSDVLQSTLFAQLAASKRFDPFNSPVDWYKEFVRVLNQIGWVIGELAFSEASWAGVIEVAKLLIIIFGKNQEADPTTVINALRGLPPSAPAITIFQASTAHQTNSLFQLANVRKEGNTLVLRGGAVYYDAQDVVVETLWQAIAYGNAHLFYSSFEGYLDLSLYDQLRAAITKKLGDHIRNKIAGFDI